MRLWGANKNVGRLSKNSCRGEHCSPVPVCLARNCPGKCVAAVSWRATNGRPYIRNKAGMQFFDSLSLRAVQRGSGAYFIGGAGERTGTRGYFSQPFPPYLSGPGVAGSRNPDKGPDTSRGAVDACRKGNL